MFSGCTSSDTDHAITVVGYGTADNGEKYWLIKNSWSVSKLSYHDSLSNICQGR